MGSGGNLKREWGEFLMAEYLAKSEDLTAVADAIRTKGGTDAQLTFPDGFVGAVQAIPAGTTITDGIVVTARDAEGFPTEADVYGDIYPFQFSYNGSYYHNTIGWRSLSKLTLKSGQTVLKEDCFAYLPLVQLNGIEGITALAKSCFANTKLVEINLPNAVFSDLRTPFSGNTALKKLYCPKLTGKLTAGTYELVGGCTALEEAVLGSVGHTVLDDNSINSFKGCTQSGLHITVFTNAANVDKLLAHIRNGATNATITIKAAADTTYNGTTYAAGNTILTSTPEAST